MGSDLVFGSEPAISLELVREREGIICMNVMVCIDSSVVTT